MVILVATVLAIGTCTRPGRKLDLPLYEYYSSRGSPLLAISTNLVVLRSKGKNSNEAIASLQEVYPSHKPLCILFEICI
jgi:hypothetical protein